MVIRGISGREGIASETSQKIAKVEVNNMIDGHESANKLLMDYQRKLGLSLLLDLAFYLCIPFAIIFFLGAAMSLLARFYPDTITVTGTSSWYRILSALLVVPIFLWRRRTESKFEEAKLVLLKTIAKGLQREKSKDVVV